MNDFLSMGLTILAVTICGGICAVLIERFKHKLTWTHVFVLVFLAVGVLFWPRG